jgi:biotin carboxyl carrier protein
VLLAYHTPPLDISGSWAIVVLVQVALVLPFCYRMCAAALKQEIPVFREAAASLGAPPAMVLRRVILPLLEPAIRASVALSFAFSLGDLGATLMVYPPGFSTAPIVVINDVERDFYYPGLGAFAHPARPLARQPRPARRAQAPGRRGGRRRRTLVRPSAANRAGWSRCHPSTSIPPEPLRGAVMCVFFRRRIAPFGMAFLVATPTLAQVAPAGPPAVGVVAAAYRPMAESTEINGRVQAEQRVDLVARVTAFLNEQLFVEGAEVKKGDLLYRLERAPFEADVEVKQAAVAEAEAQLENANVALDRAAELVKRGAGTQVTLDNARATQRTTAAQLKAAQAQLRQSQINLDYTEIRSPIDGRIGRTSVTIGNVVGPTSGTLATIVSADPMYVVFPVAMRRVLELRDRYVDKGGF